MSKIVDDFIVSNCFCGYSRNVTKSYGITCRQQKKKKNNFAALMQTVELNILRVQFEERKRKRSQPIELN